MPDVPASVDAAADASGVEPGSSIEPAADDVQLDLLGSQPVLGEFEYGGGTHTRKPGRPAGSKNKRTEDIAKFILARHRDPLIGLAEIVSTPIPALATALGCKTIEAADFWRKCVADLSKYVHQEQPKAIQVTRQHQILVAFGEVQPGTPAAQALGELGISLEVDVEENQELKDVTPAAPNDSAPNDGGKDE